MAVSSAAFHDDDTPVPVETMPTPTTTVAYTDLASVTLPTHRLDDDDDNASLNVGDASDPDDLDQDVQDADDRRRAEAQYTALPVSDDDDFMGDDLEDTTVPSASHRHQLGSALAQLPPRKQEDEDRDTGFDFFYDTPDASTSSSTALVLASTSPTSATREASAVGPFIGPANKGATASDKYKRGNRNAFTGLSNQGATCYMNSLLQTMFMTPELRLGLYKWECTDDDDAEEDNIPFQLQKLFAKLETTTLPSISTKALTKSFGWTGADVFQQHDVQELCRVLFDALEKSFKGTVNETLVNDLYQGTMKDYVQCRTCGYESSRNDEFLDLSLVIRPFGSSKNMKSVEEAIEFFLKPEVLDGDNQWNCDRCKAKRDAIKGLKFSKLPYLLSLQLKRFDYDYMTDTRVKLHDQVTFPKYLDMNSYVHEEGSGVRGSFARKMSMERHELENRSNEGAAARVRRMSSMDETNPIVSFTDEDGVPLGGNITDTWSTDFNVSALIEKAGPLVYELYSVLIHSGSALGGHYYAYIKSFETDKWYDFNDSTVTEMSENEVKKAWGGNTNSSYGGRMSYSTCAYMLMYRLISREENITVTSKDSIPQYLIERMREEEERHRRQELERAEMAKKMLIKFYMKTNSRNKLEKSMHVYKTATLREAHVLAYEAFAEELQGAMPKFENTRLRMYNDYTSYLNDSFEGRDERTLTQLNIYGSNQLYLEAKKDGEDWEPHDSSKLQLYVRRFLSPPDDEERQEELVPLLSPDMSSRYIQVPADSTLEEFTKVLREKFDIPAEKKIRLVRKTGTSYTSTPVKVYNKDESPQTLKSRLQKDFNFANGNEVYFEECDDLAEPSAAEKHFEREVNTIEITVWHLDAIAEKIRIDRRETVRTLKNKIANRLGLSVDKFKILRGNHRAGIEIKTIDTTLYKLSIGQGHSVYALEGTPLGTGEYLFRLMLHKTPRPTNSTGSAETKTDDDPIVKSSSEGDDKFDLDELQVKLSQDESDLENVASIKVGEEMMVDDIRQVAWQALKEKGKIPADDSIPPSHIRLRDVLSTTLTRILVNGRRLKEASSSPVYEGRGMVAQVLNEPETVQVGHHLIHVVYVDRSKWRFCKKRRFEFVVPKDQVGDEGSTDDDDDHDGFLESNALAVSTATRPSKSHSLMESNTWIPEQIALRLTIPPEQARFAAFTYGRDNYDICEVYKTDFDTWDRCMAGLRDYQNNYQLMVFVTDVDEHIGSFSVHERSLIQDFLVRKRDEMSKVSDRSYSSYTSNYRKPKETGVVIRTKASKSSENKGGSTASVGSGGKSSGNAVNIRTSKRKPAASSDTDEEDSLYD